jgi:hypothetical protein
MTTHKIIYLVNDWVYQSPVFGKLRALGFYPVSQGIENGMDQLKEKLTRDILWWFSQKQNVLTPMISKDFTKELFTC